jgi:5S rRNA maturation endonuclease (ribonuclease M5)
VGREVGLDRAEIKSTLKSAEREGRKKPRESRKPSDAEPPFVLPPEDPVYPPHHVWTALWKSAEGVFVHDEPCDWLVSRGVDLERLSGAGLCKYLPQGAALPDDVLGELREAIPKVAVADVYKHAPLHGFRLLLRLYDSMGDPRSLQMRRIVDHGDDIKAKGVSLKPQKRGLILANRAGVLALRRDPMRKEWADRLVEYVIVEGEPDFLVASCENTQDDRVRVVFGITGHGSWSDAHASAIPQDAHVIIATDDDGPGDKYAAKIKPTLYGRRVSLWKPLIQGQDVCDAGGLGGGTIR